MKAIIITSDDVDGSGHGDAKIKDLKLRLVAEGANDRTLMRMLEAQHPSILRLREGSEIRLEIPIVSREIFDLPRVEAQQISSGTLIPHGQALIVTSDPWIGAPSYVTLRVANPDSWTIEDVLVNGRTVCHAAPFDHTTPFHVYPGTIVQVTAKLCESSEGEEFAAELRGFVAELRG